MQLINKEQAGAIILAYLFVNVVLEQSFFGLL